MWCVIVTEISFPSFQRRDNRSSGSGRFSHSSRALVTAAALIRRGMRPRARARHTRRNGEPSIKRQLSFFQQNQKILFTRLRREHRDGVMEAENVWLGVWSEVRRCRFTQASTFLTKTSKRWSEIKIWSSVGFWKRKDKKFCCSQIREVFEKRKWKIGEILCERKTHSKVSFPFDQKSVKRRIATYKKRKRKWN